MLSSNEESLKRDKLSLMISVIKKIDFFVNKVFYFIVTEADYCRIVDWVPRRKGNEIKGNFCVP